MIYHRVLRRRNNGRRKKNRANVFKKHENVFENDRMQQNGSRRATTASSEMFPPSQNGQISCSSVNEASKHNIQKTF